MAVVVAKHLRHLSYGNGCNVTQRDGAAIRSDDGRTLDFLQRVCVFRRILHVERGNYIVSVFDTHDIIPADRVTDRHHGLIHRHAVLGHPLQIVLHIDVIAFRYPLGDNGFRPREIPKHGFDLL